MAPGGTLFRFAPHFGENVLPHGSHEWLPYSKDEVRLKTVNNNFPYKPIPVIVPKNLPAVILADMGILIPSPRRKEEPLMNVKGWAITAGLGAAAGAVAVLMMPRNNPTRRLAAKAANKMEDVAWKVSDTVRDKMDNMDF